MLLILASHLRAINSAESLRFFCQIQIFYSKTFFETGYMTAALGLENIYKSRTASLLINAQII